MINFFVLVSLRILCSPYVSLLELPYQFLFHTFKEYSDTKNGRSIFQDITGHKMGWAIWTLIIHNITGRDEHVPAVNRYIRTLKELVKAIANVFPLQDYPPRVIVKMVYDIEFWLICYLDIDAIHWMWSPRAIITGSQIDYNSHCKLRLAHM